MKTEDMKRQVYNFKALSISYDDLKESLSKGNEFEIFKSISEALLWTISVNDWFYQYYGGWKGAYAQNNKGTKEGQVLIGLRHAYNSIKHNMLFDIIHDRTEGFTLSFTLPFTLGSSVLWIEAGETLPADPNKTNEVCNKAKYEQHLERKEVLNTFRIAMDFLLEEKEKISELNKDY